MTGQEREEAFRKLTEIAKKYNEKYFYDAYVVIKKIDEDYWLYRNCYNYTDQKNEYDLLVSIPCNDLENITKDEFIAWATNYFIKFRIAEYDFGLQEIIREKENLEYKQQIIKQNIEKLKKELIHPVIVIVSGKVQNE